MKTIRFHIIIAALMLVPKAQAQQAEENGKFTLAKCIEMALQHNAQLKNARLDMEMAEAEKKNALTNFFPQVNAMGGGFVGAKDIMRGEMAIPQMGAMPLSMIKKGVLATLTALQPLYTGGQVINGNRLAELQQEVRRLEYDMTRKDVIQNVHNYYWKIISLRSNISTLDAVDKQLNEVHSLAQQFLEAGVTNRNDLLRIEINQQEVASQRLKLNNGIEVLRLLLAQLCGADMLTFDIQSQNILDPAVPETYFIPTEKALANREETKLLSKSVTANALQVKMERGKNLPTVSVGATALYYNMMEKNQGNLIGLATVSVPLSAWWGGSHQIRKAKLAHEQSKNNQRDSQEKLQIEILTAWNAVRESYAQIEIARKSVAQANENLRMNRDRYNAGTQDLTELLDAVTLFAQSQNSLTSACADYQSRVADYQRKTR